MTKIIKEVVAEVANEKVAEELVTLKELVIDLNLDYEKKAKTIRQALRSRKSDLKALENHSKKSRYEFDTKEAEEIKAFITERFITKKDDKKDDKKTTKKDDKKPTKKPTKKDDKKDDKKTTSKKSDVKAKKTPKKATKKATKKVSE